MPEPNLVPRVAVRVLPEQKHLAAIARQIRSSRQAHSLRAIADLFASNPSWCILRIEARNGTSPQRFEQCRKCGVPALDHNLMVSHLITVHLEEYFDREEKIGNLPEGTFVCVARCDLSGVLLGPPNHHTYNDKVEEIRRTKFPHLTPEEYRNSIKIVRDPELIDQWKEESRLQVVYRRKDVLQAEAAPLRWSEAAAIFVREIAPSMISFSARVIFPATILPSVQDRVLRKVADDAYLREKRFPRSLLFALRTAFFNMRLHCFSGPGGVEYVTGVQPQPLPKEHVVELIRNMLSVIESNPPMSKTDLLVKVFPGATPDSPQVREFWITLGWLLERGHVLEFADGTLAAAPPLGTRGANSASQARM
ncbi:MAG: hypothetical protein ACUVWX_04675 [Kiritimatiellia bacterium]